MRPHLRYELHAFLDSGHKSFALKRVDIFLKTERILAWKQSLPRHLQPRNLNALLYARFRVTKKMLLDENANLMLVSNPSSDQRLREFLSNVDEEIMKEKFTRALNTTGKLTEDEVYFKSIFDGNDLKESFRLHEKTLYKALSTGSRLDNDLWERFVMYNEESLRYCSRRLQPDIVRLETWTSRLKRASGSVAFQTAFGVSFLSPVVRSIFEKFF